MNGSGPQDCVARRTARTPSVLDRDV
jgi:hypothetical protein